MSLDWAAAEVINASSAQKADEFLREMVKAIVDSLGKITDEARERLALHMAEVYGSGARSFCAVPSVESDEKLALTVDGAEYLRLRGAEDPFKPDVVVVSDP